MEAAAPAHTAARVRPGIVIGAVSLGVAALSLLLPSTPSYDPWAWLVWGREIAGGELDTTAGPAWKPLPVAVTALLAPFGAAPELWLLLARAAGVAAVLLVGRLAWRLSGGSVAAGAIAALSLLLVAGFVRGVALGFSEGLLVALLAGAAFFHLDGLRRHALVLATLAALLRPEVWPFLLAYGVVLWRRGEERPLLVAAAAVVPLAWFAPELWGSGELLRSTERARVPNPGQPALAAVPALEVLKRFALTPPPLAIVGLLLALRRLADLVRPGRTTWSDLLNSPAIGAFAWVGLVALMSQLGGFSGEERYLLPAAAAACVAAGVAWAGYLRRGLLVAFALLALVPMPFVAAEAAELRRDLADDAALAADLERAIAGAGGADELRCGELAAGRYRFPLVAWHLDVPISSLAFGIGTSDGTVLRSRLRRGHPLQPAPPSRGRVVARAGTWQVWSSCAT